ncbi:MAG: peptidoglycan-binding protein [Candidatus Omnitrophota bacterium]|nr:peptidoglycan-binding protein [Candidatus Omnitrophota bacterium]MDZ4242797.1 peptidoglycan-binding protein [Candidatus Omnitrophota bacterium]
MVTRWLVVLSFVMLISGCATANKQATVDSLQMRVTELERAAEDKDDQIKSLNDEVRDLSYQLDRTRTRSVKVSDEGSSSSSGATGDIIRVSASTEQVQKALKNAGYYQGAVDGKLGAKTKKAISDFQKDHELKADGVVGRKTWAAMQSYLK